MSIEAKVAERLAAAKVSIMLKPRQSGLAITMVQGPAFRSANRKRTKPPPPAA